MAKKLDDLVRAITDQDAVRQDSSSLSDGLPEVIAPPSG